MLQLEVVRQPIDVVFCMRKKPPFRVDDLVKIVTPQFFVRCGYPLCKADAFKALDESEVGDKAKALLKLVNLKPHIRMCRGVPDVMTRDYRKILDVFVTRWLDQHKFGGPERTIHTKEKPELKDKVFQVVGQKFHKTGKRVPGYSGGGGYWAPDDPEPPYLDDVKTHRILLLDQPRVASGHPYIHHITDSNDWPIAIEACHVKKVKPVT